MRMWIVWLGLLLPACHGGKDDGDSGGKDSEGGDGGSGSGMGCLGPEADDDRDGHGDISCGGDDCDDDDDDVYPGAPEIMGDGIDNDCDGEIDATDTEATGTGTGSTSSGGRDSGGDGGSGAVYVDDDRDGYTTEYDCDDTRADISPREDELCEDGLDNNCDGNIDEDTAVDALAWYFDYDGDGFGDGGVETFSCTLPTGYVADDTDCDDADSAINPAALEVCDAADVDEDCDGLSDDADPGALVSSMDVYYRDVDGDGYGTSRETVDACDLPVGYADEGGDCDDDVVYMNPGALEICDGLDDDCDGVPDDGATDARTVYFDADGDGYGDPSVSDLACGESGSWIYLARDCDDANDAINPDAAEACDGVDQDCNGYVDDYASDMTVWYPDADFDGYGDMSAPFAACEALPGWISVGRDCDDHDATISPGADEHCDDLDEDCDGVADNDAVDAPTWYRDADGDTYGVSSSATRECDRPAGYVSRGSDCDDTRDDVYPTAQETCPDGRDSDCDGSVDEGSFVISQEIDLDAGSTPIYLIDINFLTTPTGARDLLVAGYENGTVYHLENDGEGKFSVGSAIQQIELGVNIRSLAAANIWDLDHDNYIAVDASYTDADAATLFLGDTGSGGLFQGYYSFNLIEASSYDYGGTPRAVKSLNCDGSGEDDAVVVGDNDDGYLRLWRLPLSAYSVPPLSGGSISMGAPDWTRFVGGGTTGADDSGPGPIQIRIGDLNAAGMDDLVVANGGDDTFTTVFLKSDGVCGLGTVTEYRSSDGFQFVSSIAVRDLDGDGDIDVAAAYKNSDRVVVFGNGGGGTLTEGQVLVLPSGADPDGLAAPDLNDDGYNDLAVVYQGLGTLGLWVFDPETDTFLESVELDLAETGSSASYSPREVEYNSKGSSGDRGFGGDGDEDLAVVNANADSVTILEGQCKD